MTFEAAGLGSEEAAMALDMSPVSVGTGAGLKESLEGRGAGVELTKLLLFWRPGEMPRLGCLCGDWRTALVTRPWILELLLQNDESSAAVSSILNTASSA